MNQDPDAKEQTRRSETEGPPFRLILAGFLFVVVLVGLALYLVNSMMSVCAVAGGRIC